IAITNIQYAIVLQQMLPATRSGVAFSMHLQGNMADMLVVVGYGLGEGIVSDQVETDTYVVNRQHRTIQSHIPAKQLQLVHQAATGLALEALSEERQNEAVLSEKEVLAVCEQCHRAEQLMGQAADIEFSFDASGKLFMLQMRPISTIKADKLHILDNTNIVESYPGITLPLSFSFARNAYEKVFRGSSGAFWVSEQQINTYSQVLSNLIAHAYGRVYYRLDNWYRMVGLVYSSKKSLDAWEKSVGLLQTERHKVRFSLRNTTKTVLSLLWLLFNYRRGNRRFFHVFAENYAFMQAFTDHRGNAKALWEHYDEASKRLFKSWYLTLINDFLAFKAFGWLQDLSKRYGLSGSEDFANDLLCGMGGVESEEAVLNVLQLKAEIERSAKLKSLFQQSAKEVLGGLQAEEFNDFREAFERHLARFGDRTLAELKLEVPSMRSNPVLFVKLLQHQLGSPVQAEDFQARQKTIYEEAQKRVDEILPRYRPKRWLFGLVKRIARYGLRNRENMRLCRTRGYGAVKDIFLAIADCMLEAGAIDERKDIFYLHLDELRDWCMGEKRSAKQPLIKQRKAQYASYAEIELPDRIIYDGQTLPSFAAQSKVIETESSILQGQAVSQGMVEAEAIVLQEASIDAAVKGKILVSRMTDPGWVFLMTQAVGLISEKGSLLSHTAIVGRELGIPVVVGVSGATQQISNGQRLRLDGSTGTVEIISD
ncbi:MAG: PEP/pyruvate-binding domain-containing protein, partial [Bacteroidota bacterium]